MLKLALIAASNRQPDWVEQGANDYARRLRGRCTLEITTVPLARRSATTPVARAVAEEGERLLAKVPQGAHVVALLEQGTPFTTRVLATKLEGWMQRGAPVCFLVGGPDGLAGACLERHPGDGRAPPRWRRRGCM